MNGCLSWLFTWFLPPQLAYEEALRRATTLDLVYFCQLGTWTGPFVALFSGKMITHMGVLWRHPRTGKLWVLESTRHEDNAGDLLQNGRVHTGVRLTSLEEKLQHPSERYFVCVQPVILTRDKRERAERVFNQFIQETNGIQFEQDVSSFLLAQLPENWRFHRGEDTSSLYCSELAALALRECGLLPGVNNVSRVWPSMLYTCQLQLGPDAHLSPHKFLISMQRRIWDDTAMLKPPPAEHRVLIADAITPPTATAAAAAASIMSAEEAYRQTDEIVARLRAQQSPVQQF